MAEHSQIDVEHDKQDGNNHHLAQCDVFALVGVEIVVGVFFLEVVDSRFHLRCNHVATVDDSFAFLNHAYGRKFLLQLLMQNLVGANRVDEDVRFEVTVDGFEIDRLMIIVTSGKRIDVFVGRAHREKIAGWSVDNGVVFAHLSHIGQMPVAYARESFAIHYAVAINLAQLSYEEESFAAAARADGGNSLKVLRRHGAVETIYIHEIAHNAVAQSRSRGSVEFDGNVERSGEQRVLPGFVDLIGVVEFMLLRQAERHYGYGT